MLRSFLICMLAAISIAASQAQTQGVPKTPASRVVGAESQGAASEAQPKPVKSFDVSLLDRSVDPCTDFYRFAAAAGWRAIRFRPIRRYGAASTNWRRTTSSSNAGFWSRPRSKARSATPTTQKIGDYYASCMDEAAIEKKGLEPLRAELDRIAGLESKAELPAYLAHAHRIGSNAFFEFSSQPDFQNASPGDRRDRPVRAGLARS